MKDKDKKDVPVQKDEERIHVTQSVFKTAHDLQQERNAKQEELQRQMEEKIAARKKQQEEAREKRLLEEKKELIRLKQGQIEESEIICEEAPEAVKLTAWESFKNFIYHNKWWLGFGIFFAFVAVFLIYDLVTKERPDMVIIMTAECEDIGKTDVLTDYAESFCEDFNDNDEVLVALHYMPYSDNYRENYAYGTDTKLTVEFQSAEAVIVISDSKLESSAKPEEIYVNLSELYPDNPNVDGYVYKLKGSAFAERLGVSNDIVRDDIFLAIRKPQKLLYCDEDEMQETYDRDFAVFDKIIKDLSE